MAWIKKDTRTLKDPKIVELLAQPKGAEAYVLWDAALFEAYHQTPKGEFANEAHLKACVAGVADIKHLKRLLGLGLLTRGEGGSIIVTNWGKHQADPTAAVRKERYKNAHGTELERNQNALDKNRTEQRENRLSYSKSGIASIGEILAQGGKK
jgi:hypothetical protein